MAAAGVPAAAQLAIARAPCVVKADGLAAGKGVLLPADGVVENLAEDSPNEGRVEPESLAVRRAVLQQSGFAIVVANGALAFGLHPGDVTRQPRPFTQRRHQHRIDVVETLP